MAASRKTILEIDGVEVPVSNLDKVMYPACGFTKADVIDYYVRIADVLLPYLKRRPITLKRYPDGVEGFSFYEKRCPAHRPEWVATTKVPRSKGGTLEYCVMDDLPALVWAANLADLELHTFQHVAKAHSRPQFLVFDLDPGAPADIVQCCGVALLLYELFADLGMQCFPKTSGSKGLQIVVPLHGSVTYARTKAFARAVAEKLEHEHPDLVLSSMRRSLRKGKVFIDWSQNDEHKTTINVYSLRARPTPTVSMPVTWAEVRSAWKRKKGDTLVFEAKAALARVKRRGDLFAPVLELPQSLPALAALQE